MTEVPVISITLDENENQDDDDDSRRPSIADCHTDVEDLDGDEDRKNSLIAGINAKCNGAVTDVEDMDDSGDDNEDEPEIKYPEVDLSELLDQGCIDESSNMMGNQGKKLVAMHSVVKSPSLTAFNLGVNFDQGGVTDLEDVEGSGDDADENEKVYSDDDRVIVLEESSGIDIHDSVGARKKVERHVPRVKEPSSPSASSSESEDEKPKMRLKTQKHYTKKSHKCSDAKSDVENILFSDDERRKSRPQSSPVLETPDIEVMAFEGSDHEDVNEPQFPEINISFVAEEKPKNKKKYRSTPAPSPMLALPQNQDEGHTDVENLNSSDDDDDQSLKTRPKSLIPIAVIKSDALTDVEDFGEASDDDCDLDEKPDIPLPSPVREFTMLVENRNGEPVKQTKPLPDNLLLGFHDLDADKGLTDVEDFSDEVDDEDDDETPKYEIDYVPELEGGFIESSDHSNARRGSLGIGTATPEPITDTEDMFMKRQDKSGGECRRRRTKPKHSHQKQKTNFLDTKFYVDANAGGAHTDVEDLDVEEDDVLLKDKTIKQRRATVDSAPRKMSNPDGKTDVEYMSGDDAIDLLRFSPELNPNLSEYQLDTCSVTLTRDNNDGTRESSRLEINLPEIRKISPTPENFGGTTDTEDINCNSDNDNCAISYSRAQTATPMELSRDLDESCTSQIHEIHSGTFDRVKAFSEMKENLCLVDSVTDVENFDEN